MGSDMFEMIANCIYMCMLCDFMTAATGWGYFFLSFYTHDQSPLTNSESVFGSTDRVAEKQMFLNQMFLKP